MKKQNNPGWGKVLLATIATIFLLGTFALTFAQDAPKFKVGDRIKNPDDNALGTVVKIELGWVHVKYDNKEGEYEVMMSGGLILLDANDKPIANGKAAQPKETTKTDAKNDRQDTRNDDGKFKVGDRVKVTISGQQADENFQPCTITRGLKSNQYGVRCDPHGKLSYMDYNVLPEWVRPWAGANTAPQLECLFDTPAGTVSKTGAPSAQLFKRVIYEQMAAVETARLGLQFTTFQMGTPFRNVMTGRGLLKDTVPQNAMIYPVKTQFKTCKEGSLDYNFLRVTKENFSCYKNRFGEWFCGSDGGPEFLESQDVPKKQ